MRAWIAPTIKFAWGVQGQHLPARSAFWMRFGNEEFARNLATKLQSAEIFFDADQIHLPRWPNSRFYLALPVPSSAGVKHFCHRRASRGSGRAEIVLAHRAELSKKKSKDFPGRGLLICRIFVHLFSLLWSLVYLCIVMGFVTLPLGPTWWYDALSRWTGMLPNCQMSALARLQHECWTPGESDGESARETLINCMHLKLIPYLLKSL